MHEIVSDLRRDHDVITLLWESLGDQLLAQSVSISISRVEQREAEIECLMHQRNRFAFGEISPPTRGNCPEPKPDLANRQVGVLVSAESHMETISSSVARMQATANPTALLLSRAKSRICYFLTADYADFTGFACEF